MKTKECPSCAMDVEAKSKTCPICNYEFPERDPAVKWVAILLIIAILVGMFFLRNWF